MYRLHKAIFVLKKNIISQGSKLRVARYAYGIVSRARWVYLSTSLRKRVALQANASGFWDFLAKFLVALDAVIWVSPITP